MANLTIANPNINTGDVLNFSFSGMGPFEQVWVGVIGGGGLYFTAGQNGAGGGSFQIGEGPGTYTLEAYDSIGNYATRSFTVSGTVYNPTLTCTASVAQGAILNFSFAGFPPNVQVYVGVVGGGGAYFNANSSGAGSGSFTVSDAVGSHILEAMSTYYRAETTFTVTAGQSAGWHPMLSNFITSGTLSYGLPKPSSSSATIPTSAQPGSNVQVIAYITVGNIATMVKVIGTYGSSTLPFSPAQTTLQNGTQSFVASFTMPSVDTVVALTFQYWNGVAWVTFNQLLGTVTSPQSVGWHPMLTAMISSGQLNYSTPQSVGWHPMLTAMITSGQLLYTFPQSAGWHPMLALLVSSDRLDFSAPQSAGWHPMLTALVASEMLKFSAAQSYGWAPMMKFFVDSKILKIPGGGGGGETGPSPWVWALVAGAVGLAAASTSKGNKPVPGSKKALTNTGKMG